MIERLTHQLVQDGISTITLYAEPQVRVEGYEDEGGGASGVEQGVTQGTR